MLADNSAQLVTAARARSQDTLARAEQALDDAESSVSRSPSPSSSPEHGSPGPGSTPSPTCENDSP
jgi:hypothetical protein